MHQQPLCVIELELLLCLLEDSTSLAVPAADQLRSLCLCHPSLELFFVSCTSDRRQQNMGTWLYLSGWLEELGPCSYTFGFGRYLCNWTQKWASWVMGGTFGPRL